MPIFSVIMACLDAEQHIAEALESVSGQTYPDWELVVVDGGSTDGTPSVLERYAARLGDRMTWRSEPDDGLYDAMNRGIERARGDYVVFLGADDRLAPGALRAVASLLERTPADLVFGATHVFDATGGWHEPAREVVRRGMPQRPPARHQSTFTSIERLRAVGGFDTRYRIAADYDLYLRLSESRSSQALIGDDLSYFRLGGVSSRSALATAREYRDIRMAHGASPLVEEVVMGKALFASALFAGLRRLGLLGRGRAE